MTRTSDDRDRHLESGRRGPVLGTTRQRDLLADGGRLRAWDHHREFTGAESTTDVRSREGRVSMMTRPPRRGVLDRPDRRCRPGAVRGAAAQGRLDEAQAGRAEVARRGAAPGRAGRRRLASGRLRRLSGRANDGGAAGAVEFVQSIQEQSQRRYVEAIEALARTRQLLSRVATRRLRGRSGRRRPRATPRPERRTAGRGPARLRRPRPGPRFRWATRRARKRPGELRGATPGRARIWTSRGRGRLRRRIGRRNPREVWVPHAPNSGPRATPSRIERLASPSQGPS